MIVQSDKENAPILSYKDMTQEIVQTVLNTLAGYELNHESPWFSIYDAKYFTANLISISAAVKDPKYHVKPTNN